MTFDFESFFRNFVKSSGGECLPEAEGKTADFLFRKENVIAELKTLEEDARQKYGLKMNALVRQWMGRGLLIVGGRNSINLRSIQPSCQAEWLAVLQPPIESIIRNANRQIRETRLSALKPDANGLLLIANDGNFLHTSPVDYMNLVARILNKKDESGGRRFPCIQGVIYFSYRITTAKEGLPFWVGGLVDPRRDLNLGKFQDDLKSKWYQHVAATIGLPVTEVPLPVDGMRLASDV